MFLLMLNEVRKVKIPPVYPKRLAEFVMVMINKAFSFKHSLLRSLFGIQLHIVGFLLNALAGGIGILVSVSNEKSNFVTAVSKFEFPLKI